MNYFTVFFVLLLSFNTASAQFGYMPYGYGMMHPPMMGPYGYPGYGYGGYGPYGGYHGYHNPVGSALRGAVAGAALGLLMGKK
ncbi:unnamed protein product [Caenorhabditis bovis]|uniref:Uncharacterized protein n=1 Tax=Caenorhabditis bovis TaxID=2654633 RepID=A0A8S1EKW1_9PELO|nr:unnamed protein product [Caenorhabditis bovis]